MRKIDNKLIARMINGDLSPLLDYIKSDNELRIEVRQDGDAYVYYRKGKALEIKTLKVDPKYGNIPPTNLAISNPAEYFEHIKKTIDKWLEGNPRHEFDTQQNIAKSNQDITDKYVILDMEYAFEQNQIEKNNREKRAVFDLLGIERETNKIIFFEVKKGMDATKGKSGIEEHINDFENYLYGKNSDTFRTNLFQDIKNIIEDKTRLGILNGLNLFDSYSQKDPDLVFVFHPDNDSQIQDFSTELKNRYKLIIVNENDYKLK
ncbi:hypothetical protein LA303_09005 [Candidatus Sulfidibacterium hydrothermale]|uniref:hypothetical protein n=1 Tax=Candidatus Sulfidibacterium hydrothermale TaxID=2875962 RepID=UPI001F0B6952|nr:hypothetical protein [Candidatus Sulfidibacterium hydrothermale]UBM61552.1 hypothetical protein LA303_09005 [Candidatus Sulfidibacterium hydrothermale]